MIRFKRIGSPYVVLVFLLMVAQLLDNKAVAADVADSSNNKVILDDQFDGDDLAEHWTVKNPNPDGYIVEEGKLLAISAASASFAEDNIDNLFQLTKPLPKGNWRITLKTSIDFQTGKERIFYGLYKDPKNYLVSEISTKDGGCPPGSSYHLHLLMTPTKSTRGKLVKSENEVWRVPHCNQPEGFNSLMAKGQPFLLRLEKKGRSYTSSIKLEGEEKPKWISVSPLKSLRSPGIFSMGLYQSSKEINGETSLSVDWIKIEAL